MTATYPAQLAHGLTVQTAFDPFELYAGESDIVTDEGTVGATDLEQFRVIARNEDGNLVPWDNAAGAAAAVLNFTGVGTANDTVTINGQAITLVASSASTYQATIGGTATLTAQAVKAIINAHPDVFNVSASGAAASLTLTALEAGVAGNSIAVSESGTGTNFTGSVTALAGGSQESERKAIGIAAQAAAAGLSVPYFRGGVFNHAVLVWPAAVSTVAERKRAFDGSDISVRALL